MWLHLAHSNPKLWQKHCKSMETRSWLQIQWVALALRKILQAHVSIFHLEQGNIQMEQLLLWMEDLHGMLRNGDIRFIIVIHPLFRPNICDKIILSSTGIICYVFLQLEYEMVL